MRRSSKQTIDLMQLMSNLNARDDLACTDWRRDAAHPNSIGHQGALGPKGGQDRGATMKGPG